MPDVRSRSLRVAALVLGLAVVTVGPVRGQDAVPVQPDRPAEADPALTDRDAEELDARAAEIAAELRCPVCRNQSIVESNAELSREMHALVRERLEAGETPDEVKAYFVSRYGEWILLEPQRRGINWLVWGLPFVALIAGGVLAVMLVRRWAAATPDASPAPATGASGISAENERWLEEALREG